MAPAIGEMVSACFYDNELKTGVIEPFDKPYQEDMVRVVPNIYFNSSVQELRSTVAWVDTSEKYSDGVGTTFYNKHEARKIMALLEKIHSDEQLLKELKTDQSQMSHLSVLFVCTVSKNDIYVSNLIQSHGMKNLDP
jgi:hypothetical protein